MHWKVALILNIKLRAIELNGKWTLLFPCPKQDKGQWLMPFI